MLGTLINAGAVIAGSLLGLLINIRLPRRITAICFQGIGLFTLFIGVFMAMKTSNFLIMIFSVVIGGVLGEWLALERHLDRFSEYLKRRVRSSNARFSEGLVTAFLLWCMGSMTILGAFEEGMGGEPNLLLAKSVLDGFSSIALAASMGAGVMFAAIPLLVYQGALTLFAGSLEQVLSQPVVAEMSAVGGLLLLGLGLQLLEIKAVKVLNMLPSLVVAVVLGVIFI